MTEPYYDVEWRAWATTVSHMPMAMPVLLRYRAAEPHAVYLKMPGPAGPIQWVFARELLRDGLYRTTGLADVCVGPNRSLDGVKAVFVTLRGQPPFTFSMPMRDVRRFVEQVYAAVPDGAELDYMDLDAHLGRLLEEGAGER